MLESVNRIYDASDWNFVSEKDKKAAEKALKSSHYLIVDQSGRVFDKTANEFYLADIKL